MNMVMKKEVQQIRVSKTLLAKNTWHFCQACLYILYCHNWNN